MAKITRNVARLKEIELLYLDTKTQGPCILCLHGRWGRAQVWEDFMRRYGDEYRVIAPDQRGHGFSSKPVSKYTGEEMAADMAELLDYLNIDSAIVAGHSMGGRVAGYLAALYPERVRALAILDKSASGAEEPSSLPPGEIPAVDPITKDWPLPFATLGEAKAFIKEWSESELEYEYFMNSIIETPEGYTVMFSIQAMAANIAYDQSWFHMLPKIKCPVLLLRANGGDNVPDGDFAMMQSLLPDCIAREASSPDHNVILSDKEEFYGYFDELLKRV
jgi:2-succinyl-6-hydroxy-2,4-cyclohexadiene-1-carboxylate synthase